jgi:hypothetical protein
MSAMDIPIRYRIIDGEIYEMSDFGFDSYYGDYTTGGWVYVCKNTPENREKLGIKR